MLLHFIYFSPYCTIQLNLVLSDPSSVQRIVDRDHALPGDRRYCILFLILFISFLLKCSIPYHTMPCHTSNSSSISINLYSTPIPSFPTIPVQFPHISPLTPLTSEPLHSAIPPLTPHTPSYTPPSYPTPHHTSRIDIYIPYVPYRIVLYIPY